MSKAVKLAQTLLVMGVVASSVRSTEDIEQYRKSSAEDVHMEMQTGSGSYQNDKADHLEK